MAKSYAILVNCLLAVDSDVDKICQKEDEDGDEQV